MTGEIAQTLISLTRELIEARDEIERLKRQEPAELIEARALIKKFLTLGPGGFPFVATRELDREWDTSQGYYLVYRQEWHEMVAKIERLKEPT